MERYILRRLLLSIPYLIGISIVAFFVLNLAPGDPMAVYTAGGSIPMEEIRRMEQILGLDQPVHIQYFKWSAAMLKGDMGYSLFAGRPVTNIITERIPATLQLMGLAYSIAILTGVFSGIISALKRYSIIDYFVTTGAMIGLSIPTFWFGMMVILFFSATLGWLPSGGIGTLGEEFSIHDRILHLIGPASVLGLWMAATWSRYTRSSVLEVIGQDYIRTAHAKGLLPRIVLFRHALRNALIPLVTLFGLELRLVFGGTLVTEIVFGWPGIGRLYVDSLTRFDYPVVMGLLLMTSFIVLMGNLIADILYSVVDPRIRYD
jgi:peptide/nickel transport system permease protein